MKSQWDCLLQNLGEWQGSFTHLSPQGDELEDTPTVVSLEGLNHNQTIRQTIRRLTPTPDEKVLEYGSLGRGVLLFDNGAFSQGSIQFGPFSEFGAELGLINGDHRLRLVQMFNTTSQLDQLTLIRERRAGSSDRNSPPLQLEDLLGTWKGEAVTIYPDWRNPTLYSTTLQLRRERDSRLTQSLSFKDGGTDHTLTSTAAINGSTLVFDQGPQTIQVLLLPDGVSSNCPRQIKSGQPFFLEVGWLLQPNLRQRMIRRYSNRGEWMNLTLVIEHKVTD